MQTDTTPNSQAELAAHNQQTDWMAARNSQVTTLTALNSQAELAFHRQATSRSNFRIIDFLK